MIKLINSKLRYTPPSGDTFRRKTAESENKKSSHSSEKIISIKVELGEGGAYAPKEGYK